MLELRGLTRTRQCSGSKTESAGGVFQVREAEPSSRVGDGAAPDAAKRSRVRGIANRTTHFQAKPPADDPGAPSVPFRDDRHSGLLI